jgi:hypothetical protein
MDDPISVKRVLPTEMHSHFKIPSIPDNLSPGIWVSPSETIKVADVFISGGMIYVGSSLKAPNGSTDPCLIDPSKPIAAIGNYTSEEIGAWRCFAEISPIERRAYLNWL